MLIDFLAESALTDARCDVCIIGGGAAGISLAQALIGSRLQVWVLESGGVESSPQIQALHDGAEIGLANANPMTCRLRYFGGTTNHWTGWCRPLDDIDFEPRAWIEGSGWPIRKSELAPYYDQAQSLCQIGAFGYDNALHIQGHHEFPAFDPDKAQLSFFRFSPPTRFGPAYRERLEKASNVTVVLNANVVALDTDDKAATVRTLRIKTPGGKTGSVTARAVVLACGGMENARMLLLANQVQATGLGNAHGMVGRYFMQHIEGTVARIVSSDPERMVRNFKRFSLRGVDARAQIALSGRAQAQHRILNSGFTIDANADRGAGYKALRSMWSDVRKGHWPDNFSSDMREVFNDLRSVGEAMYKDDEYALSLYLRGEPLPNPSSRITLGDARDVLGLPKLQVQWQLTPLDKHSVVQSTQRIAEELGRLNLGRVELAPWIADENAAWPQPLWGGCHHMGTTRMSDEAKTGVVDRHCKVHGMNNLYVAGSSVFPTAGYVPPTLTLVALALRLADRLKQNYA